jgi:hypothetical protein
MADRFEEKALKVVPYDKYLEYMNDNFVTWRESIVLPVAEALRQAERDGALRAIDACLSELPTFGVENARRAIDRLRARITRGESL